MSMKPSRVGGPGPPPPYLRVPGGDGEFWLCSGGEEDTGVLPGGEVRRGREVCGWRGACVVVVVVVRRGAGGGVSLAVVTGCGACAGRAPPPRRLRPRSLGSSRRPPPLHAASPPPPSPRLVSPVLGPVIPLRWSPGRPGATWPVEEEEEEEAAVSPPARASGPSPSSRLSLSPYPLGRAPFTPPQLRGVPREPRGLCACRWRWGLLGVDEGACAVAAAWLWRSGLAGGARLGGACAPLALSRLRRPAELPGPPVAGGGGCRVGGLSGGGLGAIHPHPPCHIRSPRRRPRAWLAPLSPLPQLPSRLSSRYLARSGAEV